MNYNPDYLIVGAGLTGSVIARLLFDRGNSVVVVDKRNHIAGNMYDYKHSSGILVHKYGPHYFRTTSDEIWGFVNRFSEFYKYEAFVKSYVDGNYENWPIAASYIKKNIGLNWEPSYKADPKNFEEAALSLMPKEIYEKFIKFYNYKQWGVYCTELSASLITRFNVREDDDPRLTPNAKYQGLPSLGYTAMFENMLKDIDVKLNFDYLHNVDEIKPKKKTIFTGPIDEFFNNIYGKLKYRGQKRETKFIENTDYYQPYCQVNEPSVERGDIIRTLEWKYLLDNNFDLKLKGTIITTETPYTPEKTDEYEYPFPDDDNNKLYLKYRELASLKKDVIICGRLGEYKYYDMDHAIERAFEIVKTIQN